MTMHINNLIKTTFAAASLVGAPKLVGTPQTITTNPIPSTVNQLFHGLNDAADHMPSLAGNKKPFMDLEEITDILDTRTERKEPTVCPRVNDTSADASENNDKPSDYFKFSNMTASMILGAGALALGAGVALQNANDVDGDSDSGSESGSRSSESSNSSSATGSGSSTHSGSHASSSESIHSGSGSAASSSVHTTASSASIPIRIELGDDDFEAKLPLATDDQLSALIQQLRTTLTDYSTAVNEKTGFGKRRGVKQAQRGIQRNLENTLNVADTARSGNREKMLNKMESLNKSIGNELAQRLGNAPDLTAYDALHHRWESYQELALDLQHPGFSNKARKRQNEALAMAPGFPNLAVGTQTANGILRNDRSIEV